MKTIPNRGITRDPLLIRPGLYWVGVLDPDLRTFDILMTTEFGSTYNSYLLQSNDSTILFETAKAVFQDEYFQRLAKIIDPAKITHLVVDHTEPDHSGCIEKLLDLNPELVIVGTSSALMFLKEIVNRHFKGLTVKDGDALYLGDKTLKFIGVPNLHWPDTMFTYVPEDKILFTCDAFGAHYCHEGILRSTLLDEEGYRKAARYYFDMILGPFVTPFVQTALAKIKDLKIDLIGTGHGPVLDAKISQLLGWYGEWAATVPAADRKSVVIAYVSAYGYTKLIAEQLADGIRGSGDLEILMHDLTKDDSKTVLAEIARADGFLLGTPTMVGQALKPIWDLTIGMLPPIHGKKFAGAFGSYGWSGEGPIHITERLKQLNMKVVEPYRVRFKPTAFDLHNAYEYGFEFGCLIQNIANSRRAKK